MAVRNKFRKHWKELTVEQVFMFLRLMVEYPELKVGRELMDAIDLFFSNPAYFKNGLHTLKSAPAGAAGVGVAAPAPAGTGAVQHPKELAQRNRQAL